MDLMHDQTCAHYKLVNGIKFYKIHIFSKQGAFDFASGSHIANKEGYNGIVVYNHPNGASQFIKDNLIINSELVSVTLNGNQEMFDFYNQHQFKEDPNRANLNKINKIDEMNFDSVEQKRVLLNDVFDFILKYESQTFPLVFKFKKSLYFLKKIEINQNSSISVNVTFDFKSERENKTVIF